MEGVSSNPAHTGASPPDVAPSAPAEYLSCRFIERGIVFYPGRLITPCCANPATGHAPVLAQADGLNFPLDVIFKERGRIIERHKNGDIVPECKGCPRLEKADWPAVMSSYTVDEVTVMPFSSCNIRCNYCYTVYSPDQKSLLSKSPRVLPVFEQLIDNKLLDPSSTVRFSGGEPTLSPEFEPLLGLLTQYGVRCIIYTNATKRSEAIMEALRRDKVELVLGIDAASVEVYKAIKKMNYNEKVWKVTADYCATIPPGAINKVWAKFIFCVENYHEAEPFVRRAHAAGAKYVYYDVDASRIPARSRDGVPLPEAIAESIAVLRHECQKRGIVAAFAEAGLPWLTPERSERIEREIDRLNGGSALVAATREPLAAPESIAQPALAKKEAKLASATDLSKLPAPPSGAQWDGILDLIVAPLSEPSIVDGQVPLLLTAPHTSGRHALAIRFRQLVPGAHRVMVWLKTDSGANVQIQVRDAVDPQTGNAHEGDVRIDLVSGVAWLTEGNVLAHEIVRGTDGWMKASIEMHSANGQVFVTLGMIEVGSNSHVFLGAGQQIVFGGIRVIEKVSSSGLLTAAE